ncbi:hypothetical protein KY363_02900 [Candidatus Woesearchaeota archaeon]|nr:hypothetical protein [Candidatus Woesearchaeota archaeon]
MKKRAIIAISLMMILALLLGCAQQNEKRDVRSQTAKTSVEDSLLSEMDSGKLVEVYQKSVELKSGDTVDNWLIINNIKDAGDTFSIEPCSGCTFDSDFVDISLGKYSIVKFKVSAEAGAKEIRIKDSHSNAYGSATFNVIVE